MSLDLFTNRFSDFRPQQGVPVRTTAGAPRFQLKYPLVHHARSITPQRSFLRSPRPVYLDAYRAMLDAHGVKAIAAELLGISEAAGDGRLVLLCFDKLTVPGPDAWCHRTMFAQWWLEQTGDEVRELSGPAAAGQQLEQGRLL